VSFREQCGYPDEVHVESELESLACTPVSPQLADMNESAVLPYGCTIEAVYRSMVAFTDFLGFINTQLNTRQMARLESILMPANFSSIVGEFIGANIPKHCNTLVRNQYHNGHPDLIPRGMFPHDSVLHSNEGIEIKASRYSSGWQGHNPEHIWLLIFVFDSNRPGDASRLIKPRPFQFKRVIGAQLETTDWNFSGRSSESRRTITASVTRSGYDKLMSNTLYLASE
jgi:hypothetical protein